MTNSALVKFLEKYKIKFIRTDVGDRNIIREMKKRNLVLGGEPSGHIILNNLSSSGDGLLAALEVLHTLREKNKKLSYFSKIYKPFPQITDSITADKNCSPELLLKVSREKIMKLKNSFKTNVRLLVRKSGTENKIRIMVESKNKKEARLALQKSKKILKNIKI